MDIPKRYLYIFFYLRLVALTFGENATIINKNDERATKASVNLRFDNPKFFNQSTKMPVLLDDNTPGGPLAYGSSVLSDEWCDESHNNCQSGACDFFARRCYSYYEGHYCDKGFIKAIGHFYDFQEALKECNQNDDCGCITGVCMTLPVTWQYYIYNIQDHANSGIWEYRAWIRPGVHGSGSRSRLSIVALISLTLHFYLIPISF